MDTRVDVYLDLGCNDGQITRIVAEMVRAKEVYGIDIDRNVLEKAKKRGLRIFVADLSKDRIPLENESIDLVTAFEVIEHLINPDNMLRETFRVLKKGGYLLLSTPNLASWVNRIIMLLGYRPYNVEASQEILAGVLWKAYSFPRPTGHIRAYTLRALKELLTHYGFKTLKVKGARGIYPKWLSPLDHLFSKRPSLARRLIILSKKLWEKH